MRARGTIQSPVLVGRDSFLGLIEDRLAGVAAGEGRLLFVAGEAGIGKTRLLSAVARRAGAERLRRRQGGGVPGRRAVAGGPAAGPGQ